MGLRLALLMFLSGKFVWVWLSLDILSSRAGTWLFGEKPQWCVVFCCAQGAQVLGGMLPSLEGDGGRAWHPQTAGSCHCKSSNSSSKAKRRTVVTRQDSLKRKARCPPKDKSVISTAKRYIISGHPRSAEALKVAAKLTGPNAPAGWRLRHGALTISGSFRKRGSSQLKPCSSRNASTVLCSKLPQPSNKPPFSARVWSWWASPSLISTGKEAQVISVSTVDLETAEMDGNLPRTGLVQHKSQVIR